LEVFTQRPFHVDGFSGKEGGGDGGGVVKDVYGTDYEIDV
jgi:hypothetical protein